jgi:hypothetical protein
LGWIIARCLGPERSRSLQEMSRMITINKVPGG